MTNHSTEIKNFINFAGLKTSLNWSQNSKVAKCQTKFKLTFFHETLSKLVNRNLGDFLKKKFQVLFQKCQFENNCKKNSNVFKKFEMNFVVRVHSFKTSILFEVFEPRLLFFVRRFRFFSLKTNYVHFSSLTLFSQNLVY